jgi:uncharacterized membrane protein
MAVFVAIWFGPWRRLQQAVTAQDWPAGAAALNRMRRLVVFNLGLGVVTIAIATLGPGWL